MRADPKKSFHVKQTDNSTERNMTSYQILDRINSPADLKQLSRAELLTLSGEIRNEILEVVSHTGGHLASSLGAVELAVALHYVFDVPTDKIIWDVGHQAYAHKLLTGRRSRFHTLRQYKGLSGFPRMRESPFDAFTTGHSSTSISAGLGMACARDLKNETGKVVAVIGDGAMTGGLAFEGLNQAGDLQKNLIVILNDNHMSISPNVGALSGFLSRTFSARKFQDFFRDFEAFLRTLPKIGEDVYQLAKRSKESFKAFITPGMLFEALNFEYFGPIDGHNLNHLIELLDNIKHFQSPVLVHVRTKKGRSYPPAEKNPVFFHGCGCFEVETGQCKDIKNPLPTFTEVFGKAIVKLAREDEKIVAITAAMPDGTGLVEFSQEFPTRFFDVGIAEQHAVTFAAGMATEGFKPVVAIYSTFLQRAFDQIIHDVCLEAHPVVFAIDRSGLVGEDGPTHHGQFDLSYLRSLPNMTIMAPRDENELCRMLKTAIGLNSPVAVRYPRGSVVKSLRDDCTDPLPVGKGEVLRQGHDVIILAIGRTVFEALTAYDMLQQYGVSATVVDCRFVKPLDVSLITHLVSEIPYVVTVEENALQGGFGSAVLECLCDQGISHFQVERVGIEDVFVEHGRQECLRADYGIDAAAIFKAAVRLCGIRLKTGSQKIRRSMML